MTRIFKSIWSEFIYGGHLLALGPTIIVFVCLKLLDLPVVFSLLVEVYLITFIVYFFDRYSDLDKESSFVRIQRFNSYKKLVPFILLVISFIVYAIMREKGIIVLLFAFLLLALGFGYSLVFKKATKYIVGFKSFYVALVFSSVSFFVTIYYTYPLNWSILLLFLFFLIRWFANTTFCDIKDRDQDEKTGLKTYAVVLSTQAFYNFLSIINFISITPIIIGIYFGFLPIYAIFLFFVVPYFEYCLILAKKNNYDIQKVTNEWADGEALLWLFLILIGGKLWG